MSRVAEELLQQLEATGDDVAVTLSVVEIYCERIRCTSRVARPITRAAGGGSGQLLHLRHNNFASYQARSLA